MIKNNTNFVVKQGNNHSNLLNQIIKIAESEDIPKSVSTFEEQIEEVLKQSNKQPTLREILAQFKPMDVSDDLGEAPLSDDIPEAGSPDDFPGDLPGANEGGDIESAKNSLAKVLVDLCGSPDEAKICIDACCGDTEEPLPEVGEPVGDLVEEPTEPMVEAPSPMPAPVSMEM